MSPLERSLAALMTSGTDEWMTPPEVLHRVETVAPVRYDPCASPSSGANMPGLRGSAVGLEGDDGLETAWTGWGHVYVNPPYSRVGDWAEKVVAEAVAGAPITLLVPARTDTRWFHRAMTGSDRPPVLCLYRGRIRFLQPDGTARTGAPFPSAFLFYNLPIPRVWAGFGDAGVLVGTARA